MQGVSNVQGNRNLFYKQCQRKKKEIKEKERRKRKYKDKIEFRYNYAKHFFHVAFKIHNLHNDIKIF